MSSKPKKDTVESRIMLGHPDVRDGGKSMNCTRQRRKSRTKVHEIAYGLAGVDLELSFWVTSENIAVIIMRNSRVDVELGIEWRGWTRRNVVEAEVRENLRDLRRIKTSVRQRRFKNREERYDLRQERH